MQAEDATLDVPQLNLPADLLAEASRRAAAHQHDFLVDGWKPTLLERLAKFFGGGRRAAPRAAPRGRPNGRH
jgi:hypothetical protein